MIFIQIGQCGIQCGQEIIQKIYKNNKSGDSIKELLIDSESKVLNEYKCSIENKNSSYKKYFQIGKDGSGNNWAYGYYRVDKELINSIMDSFSNLIESIDLHKGLNIVHSIAGGTGSGLFSRIIEELKKRYPKTCISTYSIFPFESGENALQNYNSILSLSWLQKYSDNIYCFSNKEILDIFNRTKKTINYSLNDINNFISNCASSLYPYGNRIQYINTWDIINNICPIPSMKILKIFSESSLENLINLIPNNFKNSRLISGRLSLMSQHNIDKKLLNKLNKKIGCSMNENTLDIINLKKDGQNLNNINSKSRVSLLKNSTDIIPTLDSILNKSEYMYKTKAYWNYFKKYNENMDEVFLESYNTIYDCRNAYNEWHYDKL